MGSSINNQQSNFLIMWELVAIMRVGALIMRIGKMFMRAPRHDETRDHATAL